MDGYFKNTHEDFDDIHSGSWWKLNVTSKWDIVVGLSTDGKALFSSSNYSVWLVFIVILNLPPSIRYKIQNIFLIGIYPGPKAPSNFSLFFEPLKKELVQLKDGIPISNCIDVTHTKLYAKVCLQINLPLILF